MSEFNNIDSEKTAGNGRNPDGTFGKGNQIGKQKAGVTHTANRIREAFFEVFDRLGGVEALLAWVSESKHNRKEYYKFLLNLLPKSMDIKGEGFESIVQNIIHYGSEEDAGNDSENSESSSDSSSRF